MNFASMFVLFHLFYLLHLLIGVSFLQGHCLSVSALLSNSIRPRESARSCSGSFLLAGTRPEEEEWLQKKKDKEAEQKEWDRKIREKNDRKAMGKRPGNANGLTNKNKGETKARNINTNTNTNTNQGESNSDDANDGDEDSSTCTHYVSNDAVTFAQAHSAELIALAGPKFDGDLLGVGGLDDVIAEIKRRVWTPLAAPPSVMAELGITPVRGLMLYGKSGCGKTLLARTIGKLLSPARPLTVVSGPELMDKFVGSSEKNLRELFDNPSAVYDPYRISGGKGMDNAALHVVVLDEFDAMARSRGDNDSSSAGVARDSVVNQILSKMDGVDPLPVPTLVIAMTNRPNLIDPALLRPGRFEVQIEVPPPRTTLQRKSVLSVHMNCMQEAGRLEVKDAPKGGYVSPQRAEHASMSYEELLTCLAELCDGFSGASLAAIPRAAASRALERAASKYSVDLNNRHRNKGKQDAIAMFDCIVLVEDLKRAVRDVRKSASTTTLGQCTSASDTNQQTLNGSVEIEEFVN